ncbi:hypothetical protein A2U01_0074301, partial [Trifolium medium]|nr:hypothetical protein [Trifolium medium]
GAGMDGGGGDKRKREFDT